MARPQKYGEASANHTIRMPDSLHARLSGEASSQGRSVSEHIVRLLSGTDVRGK